MTDFDTKVAVVVRDDLATWQRLNVAAFLPMLVQPVLVLEASAAKLRTVHARTMSRDLRVAIYTAELFATGHDDDNRAAVRAVATEELDLVGLALRAPHRDTDAVIRGLKRHR